MHGLDIRCLGRLVEGGVVGRFGRGRRGLGVGRGSGRDVGGRLCGDLGGVGGMEEEVVDPFAIDRHPAW